jgi:hypothetical protein
MMIKYKTPAILALRRGEASRIRSIITPVFVVVSPSGTPSELPVTRLQPMDLIATLLIVNREACLRG